MEERKPDPLKSPLAKAEARAGKQERIMKDFFARLPGSARRRMRLEARRKTGKKESFSEMSKRLGGGWIVS